MTDTKRETEVVQGQYKKNLSHIIIDAGVGPELTIGKVVLKFRKKAPVRALAALLDEENRVTGMETYVKLCLAKGQEASFVKILEDIDLDGLSEIINFLGEAYTSFPDPS